MLTLYMHCPADGQVEFVIFGDGYRPDIDSYLHFSEAAAGLIRRCVEGQEYYRGGYAEGLGESAAL